MEKRVKLLLSIILRGGAVLSNEKTQELSTLLQRIMKLHFGVAQKCLEKYGLYPAQSWIVKYLFHQEAQTQVELASKLKVTPATISAMLKRMERDEIIYRKRSVEDHRVTHVYLTAKGREQVKLIEDAFQEINQLSFQGFSESELEQTNLIFNKIIDNFNESMS